MVSRRGFFGALAAVAAAPAVAAKQVPAIEQGGWTLCHGGSYPAQTVTVTIDSEEIVRTVIEEHYRWSRGAV